MPTAVSPVPAGWRWPNFTWAELQSKDGGGLLLDTFALDRLQALRNRIGGPIIVTSAYRSFVHNRRIGSTDTSLHPQGRAFDIRSPVRSLDQLAADAVIVGFTGIGMYGTFVHVDDGPRREWRG